MTFFKNIKTAYADPAEQNESADRGDIVQVVLIILGLVLVIVLFLNWASIAIINKGADSAACVESKSTYVDTNSDCALQNRSATHSFTNDSGYKKYYN